MAIAKQSHFRGTDAQDRVLGAGPRTFLRRRWLWLAAGVGLIGLAIAWLAPSALGMLGADVSVSEARLVIATVERGEFVHEIVTEGRVVAAVSPTLFAPAGGRVTLHVHGGDRVRKGDVLARIDNPNLVARLAQERASLQNAKLEHERAVLSSKVQLQRAQRTRTRAELDLETARREYERSHKAFELGAYSELHLSRAKDTLEKAELALSEANQELEVQPGLSGFEVGSRLAMLRRQEDFTSDLERQVDALIVRSPVDGQVGRTLVADHAAVSADMPLLTVVDLSALEVEIRVPEFLARDLRTRVDARISGGGRQWNGYIGAISPEVVQGEVSARVRFDERERPVLRQNQRLSVRAILERHPNALMIDRGSISGSGKSSTAFLYVVRGRVAERQPVKIGAMSAEKMEILEGLQPGDSVVISGMEEFADARRVIISR